MSESNIHPESSEHHKQDPYDDNPGTPYPEMPLKAEDVTRWFAGQKKIFERMRGQEKAIVKDVETKLREASTQHSFDNYLQELQAGNALLTTNTVAVRNIEVQSPSGQNYAIAVIFKPRREISQKDEEPVFGVIVSK